MKRFALRTAAKCLSIGAVLIATCVAADALMNTNPPPDSHTCLGCGCVWYSGPNGSSCSCSSEKAAQCVKDKTTSGLKRTKPVINRKGGSPPSQPSGGQGVGTKPIHDNPAPITSTSGGGARHK